MHYVHCPILCNSPTINQVYSCHQSCSVMSTQILKTESEITGWVKLDETSVMNCSSKSNQCFFQVVTTEPNIEYAFAVEAVNVQGSSGFTQEKRISLTGCRTISIVKLESGKRIFGRQSCDAFKAVQLFLARFWKHFYFRPRISKSGSRLAEGKKLWDDQIMSGSQMTRSWSHFHRQKWFSHSFLL